MRFLVLFFLGCSAIFGWSWMAFWNTSNCGGNSAALANVKMIALLARVATYDTPDHTFRFVEANAGQRQQFGEYARNHWVRSARFLVSTEPILENDPQPRRIVVVCDKAYRNVPKRYFTAPPTHAVAFADGSSGLITPEEFAALDRSKFVALDTLFPPEDKTGK